MSAPMFSSSVAKVCRAVWKLMGCWVMCASFIHRRSIRASLADDREAKYLLSLAVEEGRQSRARLDRGIVSHC